MTWERFRRSQEVHGVSREVLGSISVKGCLMDPGSFQWVFGAFQGASSGLSSGPPVGLRGVSRSFMGSHGAVKGLHGWLQGDHGGFRGTMPAFLLSVL